MRKLSDEDIHEMLGRYREREQREARLRNPSKLEKFRKVAIIILAIVFFPITILVLIAKPAWDAGTRDSEAMRRGERPKYVGLGDRNFMHLNKK